MVGVISLTRGWHSSTLEDDTGLGCAGVRGEHSGQREEPVQMPRGERDCCVPGSAVVAGHGRL